MFWFFHVERCILVLFSKLTGLHRSEWLQVDKFFWGHMYFCLTPYFCWNQQWKYVVLLSLRSLSLNFNGHFPGGPGLASTRMSPFCNTIMILAAFCILPQYCWMTSQLTSSNTGRGILTCVHRCHCLKVTRQSSRCQCRLSALADVIPSSSDVGVLQTDRTHRWRAKLTLYTKQTHVVNRQSHSATHDHPPYSLVTVCNQ